MDPKLKISKSPGPVDKPTYPVFIKQLSIDRVTAPSSRTVKPVRTVDFEHFGPLPTYFNDL